MRHFYIIILFVIITTAGKGQNSFSMDEAVEFAIQNSNQLKLEQINVAEADAQILNYKAIGIPKLNGEVAYQYFIDLPTSLIPGEFFGGQPGEFAEVQFGTKNNLNASLNFNTLVFDGSFFVGLKAQRLYKELIRKQANQSESAIKVNVSKAYLAALISGENIRIFQQNVQNLEKTLDETNKIYQEGLVEKLDVDRLQLMLGNLKVDLENITRLSELSKNILKFQMGFPLDQEIELKDDVKILLGQIQLEPINPNLKEDIANRPEWSTMETAEMLNNIEIKSIQAGYFPSIYGFAVHSQSLQRNDLFNDEEVGFLPTTITGLTLNVPIFDGLDKRSRIQKAKLSLERTKVRKEIFEHRFDLEVRNSKLATINARESLENRSAMISLAESILNTAKIKYREGVGSSLEITQAESELYQAQANYISALYDLLVAKVDLDKAVG